MTNESLSTAELRSATLRGLRWSLLARPTVEVVLLASMVILARLISPAEFGRYAVALVALELCSVVAQGVGVALVQRPTVTREHVQAAFALALIVGGALVLLTFVVAATVIVPIFGERTAALVRLTTPAFFLTAASIVSSSLLQRRLEFRRLSVVDVSTSLIKAVASIALAVLGLKANALVLGILASSVGGLAMLWWWAPAPSPRLRLAPARDLLSYGLPAAVASVGWVGFRNCDYAIVGARLGVFQAGLYFRAYTLGVEYQKKVSVVMSSVGFPVLARTKTTGDLDAMRGRMVRVLTLVLFPLLVLLTILAPRFVPWLFGAAWRPAVVPTQVLAAGGAATLVIDAAGTTLMAAGRARAMLGFGWGHFGAYALAVFVVSPLGLTAVAIAAAAVHGLFVVVAYLLMLRGSVAQAVADLYEDVAPAVVSCVVLAAVGVPLGLALSAAHVSTFPYLAAVGLTSGAAYLVALRVGFSSSYRSLVALAAHLLPGFSRRRRGARLAAQSAA